MVSRFKPKFKAIKITMPNIPKINISIKGRGKH